ncbi:type II toxin-antitoxin system HicB family antitoxin [Pseudosulfitobacter pseudonitzschiae]|uniref:type II toxin-antitoxin system HicB family antitoxin n=1 Tax=Pseudosulfitobacter pseudonitzschiae TaxID=1402135 RepID=UPI001AF3515B|nr:type II toxin-antitoxin system HicB family antitoxin [Pseudosulfitobacter pseudonitzschiae]MBM1817179.1 type II toxin-antitoxin system HicB family antitoxin [Pseudosulfitobacter pseudonitzschiae]MBM1834190.1 type II toxin-antitoxin system HicB family antitoxin [Pseudosulfitobacter pseudonitzschiae]MBM1839055.1 type II toxin-antitoxin system HicB family antitoxin [Pseudosulfitobacter pseudonitzschiae]MBM1843903.1 type II toxin-antitoxin system HicB family antitoxin [Pseudosulfitobacter pseudo
MTDFAYSIVLTPDEDGGFLAFVPDLQGCMGDGDTPQDAVSDVMDATSAWMEAHTDRGGEIPLPGDSKARFDAVMKEREEYIEKLEADLLEANRTIRKLKAQSVSKSGGIGQFFTNSFQAA